MVSCFSSLFRRNRASVPKHAVDIDEEVSGIQNTTLYPYQELQVATQNFSPPNKIGQGGFGSVYKGMLQDGTLAAIKVLATESRQGVREFLTEINTISEIKHDNLVKLYGCCVEGSHRILVYNYLENNSLAQTLLGRGHSNIQFSWHTRRNICIGVAKGLAYLHDEIQPYIIHRDIKASNILLDTDPEPKISDFGLAKLVPADVTHISARISGVEGYMAPEYCLRGQVTRKADIYSFGVLLLEIVSGRSNTNGGLPTHEQHLLEAWRSHENEELVELVDTSLNRDFDVEEAHRYLKIALICTQEIPKLRPTMSTLVQMLTGEVDISKENISNPGILSELLGTRRGTSNPKQKHYTPNSSKPDHSGHIDASHGTMTFEPMFDRSN